ncbi:MAG TPA: hypothetical protein VN690_08355 [Terriglobales bacterium]|nr:hypothetical protein [Terriglobales bacterium]
MTLPRDSGAQFARFLHHRRQYSIPSGMARPDAFLPPKSKDETSVVEITRLPDESVWDMARYTLNAASGRACVLGRADFAAAASTSLGLVCARDDDGFCGHGTLSHWPTEPERRRQVALELCRLAKLKLAESPITC